LVEHLHKVYSGSARFCVMFISKHYADKVWPTHERRSEFEKAIETKEYETLFAPSLGSGNRVVESAQSSGKIRISDYKVGDHTTVKLSGGRLVEAEIKAIVETTEGKRLQVSFGNETVRTYL
jgi:hypothetical protein